MSSPGDSLDIGVREGDLLAGKYRIDRVLGVGGMGAVVAAHHIQLEEKVALKFLLPAALAKPEAVARFMREARAAVRIKSEHVARVTDVGQLDNGAPYMVMEYLAGRDFDQLLEQDGPLPPEQAVDFVLQACEAIAEAHALGIVHRDLKPANLFCIQRADGRPSVKVLDFGISKVTTPGSSHDMTRTTALVGSPMYMSPEQMQSSKNVDGRTDIWALGAILFELVSGRAPFLAESVTELAVKVVNEPAPALGSLVPGIAPGLERAVATCLEKTRDRRFQTVGDLALALSDVGSKRARVSVERILDTLRTAGLSQTSLPGSTPPPLDVTGAGTGASRGSAAVGQDTASSWGEAAAPSKPKGKVVLGAIGAAIVLVGLGGFLVLRHNQPPAPAAAIAAPIAASAPASAAAAVSLPPVASLAPEAPAAVPTPSASTPQPVVRNAPPSPAAPAPKPRANCTPPYTIDPATGEHHYKPQCL